MRKNDPCFCLVFGKANQSGLLFLIRQANLLRNNPISFSRKTCKDMYVCLCCSEMGIFVHCFLCSALPHHLSFCLYSSSASFLLLCFLSLFLKQVVSRHRWPSASHVWHSHFLPSNCYSSFTFLSNSGFCGSCFCSPLFPFLKGYKQPRFYSILHRTVAVQQSEGVKLWALEDKDYAYVSHIHWNYFATYIKVNKMSSDVNAPSLCSLFWKLLLLILHC